ncbi:SubName: Full=Uncharacterized protein {ECO:0000313/EMBL:CCA66759.1} [Serendipita indica DSM 11827]|nr:SubName: Full=Uncharacterized protein {ECO:0000313/EMBL:CCA66759.1} [Serendipita indica DSM 11827]
MHRMQHPPRTSSPLASSSSSSAIASSWQIHRQPEATTGDVFGDEYDMSPFDETALAANGLSPLSVASQSPLVLEAAAAAGWEEDEEDPFADCYHPQSSSRPARPASTSAPASSAYPRASSRPAPVVPTRRGTVGAYGRYADSSSRVRRHHQTTPSTMTSSATGLRKPQTPMQMLYDLPYTPSSTPSTSPNSRRRATLPSPPPLPARPPRVVEPDAPLVVHGTRPSPFPLGPTPPRRTGPPSSTASSSDSTDDTELVTPTTTIASTSPVTTSAPTSGMMRRKPAVTALDMERERQWALWEAEHAPSATIAVTTEPMEKKKLFSISSSKASSSSSGAEAKPKKETKKRSTRWWCCFGSSAHETDDEEEWDVEHEKSPRPASRLRKRAN